MNWSFVRYSYSYWPWICWSREVAPRLGAMFHALAGWLDVLAGCPGGLDGSRTGHVLILPTHHRAHGHQHLFVQLGKTTNIISPSLPCCYLWCGWFNSSFPHHIHTYDTCILCYCAPLFPISKTKTHITSLFIPPCFGTWTTYILICPKIQTKTKVDMTWVVVNHDSWASQRAKIPCLRLDYENLGSLACTWKQWGASSVSP
jgi:hypothetical protein